MKKELEQEVSISKRWEKLEGEKQQVMDRARKCAELTIPYLMPPDGHSEADDLKVPYQSIGARAVNNLASKLLLSLLPPNTPFFRLIPDQEALAELQEQAPDKTREVDAFLSKTERRIATLVEKDALRVPAFLAFKYLVCTGNALVYKQKGEPMRAFRLDQYCVKRDAEGHPLEIIVKESVDIRTLPEELVGIAEDNEQDAKDKVTLYTYVKRIDVNTYEVKQEVNKTLVPNSEGTYKFDELPWIPLRWTSISGEDYGRGQVEQYLGDLASLESLTEAIIEGTAAAARVLWLVNPNGTTNIGMYLKHLTWL